VAGDRVSRRGSYVWISLAFLVLALARFLYGNGVLG
jgi:hypothetical protein